MGSNRKKKVVSKPLVEEAAASSTSSTSTAANSNHHHRGTRSMLLPAFLKSVESCSSSSGCSTIQQDPKAAVAAAGLSTSTWSTDFAEALQEVEGTTNKAFHFSWKEIFTLGLALVAFAGLSIFVGVAAGISLSIHYYETQENVDLRLLNHPAMGSVPQTVTILDPTIARSNSLHPLDEENALQRVIHTSPSGRKRVLHVVEESHLMQQNAGSGGAEAVIDAAWTDPIFADPGKTASFPHRPRYPRMVLQEWLRERPKLCSDAKTIGYDSWRSLRYAIRDVNRYSANRFDRWHEYFAAVSKMQASPEYPATRMMMSPSTFEDDSMYYDEEIVLTICPGAVLKARQRFPLFINTESVVIECKGCTFTAGTSHLSFGPEAKNAVVRGVTFSHATSSSLLFHHNGADASFEDCTWVVKDGKQLSSLGSIAEVNSTSSVYFYRCAVNKPNGKPAELTSSLHNL